MGGVSVAKKWNGNIPKSKIFGEESGGRINLLVHKLHFLPWLTGKVDKGNTPEFFVLTNQPCLHANYFWSPDFPWCTNAPLGILEPEARPKMSVHIYKGQNIHMSLWSCFFFSLFIRPLRYPCHKLDKLNNIPQFQDQLFVCAHVSDILLPCCPYEETHFPPNPRSLLPYGTKTSFNDQAYGHCIPRRLHPTKKSLMYIFGLYLVKSWDSYDSIAWPYC